VLGGDFSLGNARNVRVAELARAHDTAVTPLEAGVFLHREDDRAITAILRDGNRLPEGLVRQGAIVISDVDNGNLL
jgi:hypothetical protein